MSGGSWEYLYHRIEEASGRLIESRDPLRQAFGRHLFLVAQALHDIEWVDSCDYGTGDEMPAIEAVLGPPTKALVIAEVIEDAKCVMARLQALIDDSTDPVSVAGLVRNILAKAQEPLSPKMIFAELARRGYAVNPATIRTTLRHGIKTGALAREKTGRYRLSSGDAPVNATHPV